MSKLRPYHPQTSSTNIRLITLLAMLFTVGAVVLITRLPYTVTTQSIEVYERDDRYELTENSAAPQAAAQFRDREVKAESMVIGILIVGALLFVGLLWFCFYLFTHPRTADNLYFSLACVVMALRQYIPILAGSNYTRLSGNTWFMLDYLSMALLTFFIALFLGGYATNRYLKTIRHITLAGSAVYGICVLFGDSLIYTRLLPFYQVLVAVTVLCGAAGFLWMMPAYDKEQRIALFGTGVFSIAAITDILVYMSKERVYYTASGTGSVSEAAMVIFSLTQLITLYLRSNRLIEETKKSERRLSDERDLLERLNAMKSEFLGNISHELKTPLTVISHHIQHAREGLRDPDGISKTEKAMELIDSKTNHMSLIISQLLDVSRIDEGYISLDKKVESLVEIIQSTLDNYYGHFVGNGNELVFRYTGCVPLVLCDRGRITQVLVNLITNSMRHTTQGKITVAITTEEGMAIITVGDTGEGIHPEHMPHLFDRYYTQGPAKEGSSSRWNTGTGLGMYICKYIIEAHDGSISVESLIGTGTKVTVQLPVWRPSAEKLGEEF